MGPRFTEEKVSVTIPIPLVCVCVCAGELAGDNGGSDFMWERDHEARARLWKARHSWLYAGLAMQPGKKVCLTTSP